MNYKPMPFKGIGRGYLESNHSERMGLLDSAILSFVVMTGLAIVISHDYIRHDEAYRIQRRIEASKELAEFSYTLARKYEIPFLENLIGRRTIGDLLNIH
ncbi:hypothetical protein HY449_02235 [Candidatus Pacearchaeota archaeon]|nr:hypothetical protein [Candidatus Pacearchaeota archaeon]